jgi:hypothetical protein
MASTFSPKFFSASPIVNQLVNALGLRRCRGPLLDVTNGRLTFTGSCPDNGYAFMEKVESEFGLRPISRGARWREWPTTVEMSGLKEGLLVHLVYDAGEVCLKVRKPQCQRRRVAASPHKHPTNKERPARAFL